MEGKLMPDGKSAEFTLLEVAGGTQRGFVKRMAFIMIDARSGERTIVWDRDDRLAYQPADAPVALSARGRVLHLDAHDPPACAVMARAARAAGTIGIFVHGHNPW